VGQNPTTDRASTIGRPTTRKSAPAAIALAQVRYDIALRSGGVLSPVTGLLGSGPAVSGLAGGL